MHFCVQYVPKYELLLLNYQFLSQLFRGFDKFKPCNCFSPAYHSMVLHNALRCNSHTLTEQDSENIKSTCKSQKATAIRRHKKHAVTKGPFRISFRPQAKLSFYTSIYYTYIISLKETCHQVFFFHNGLRAKRTWSCGNPPLRSSDINY